MSLAHIPNNAAILLDTNILIYAKRNLSDECRHLLSRCANPSTASSPYKKKLPAPLGTVLNYRHDQVAPGTI
jgi:hypothetical protein